ncbi:serine O-acetyltransferase [Enterococcus sp. AZ072]|uniref:serine O-acetyltransferase n=1 Tax=unclassified Enterococcus TaxID=2608891 RepID=UPI003D2D5C53
MIIFRDLKYWKSKTPSKSVVAVLLNPNFHALVCYRLASFLSKFHLSFFSKIVWVYSRILFSIDIDWRATIGEKFFICHGIGLVIGSGVLIKDEVTIYQGMTIGGRSKVREIENKMQNFPVIYSEVTIYSGAQLFGPVIIGKGAIIGAGVMVFSDVEKQSILKNRQEIFY